MAEEFSSDQFVVIPESIANLLDAGSRAEAASLNFGFSNLDEDGEGELPRPAELSAIRYTSLSGDALTSMRRDGRLNRTVYPAVRYFPQVVSLVATSERGSAKPIKRPVAKTLQQPQPPVAWSVKVTEAVTGTPIPNVLVYASPQPGRKKLIPGTTDSAGLVTLQIPPGDIDELLVIPSHTQWSRVIPSVKPTSSVFPVALSPLNLTGKSAAYMAQGHAAANADGSSVRVAVIDTGVGPHPDLIFYGGSPPQSDPGGTLDDSEAHGTHVAGIIAGRGASKGFAPGCEVFSYRVFKAGQRGALNGDIIVAIFAAVADGCHLINLSLGSEKKDPLVAKALEFAMEHGVLVVAASGNDGRKPLNFPASVRGVVSVSAVGCETTYPANSTHALWECLPRGSTASQYIAKFSNVGKILCCTAPGVAVISTVPGGYCAMDGTSMAAPVVTGIAACLLSANPAILAQKPDSSRTTAMRSLLYAACKSLGFDPRFEGSKGLPS
jgi:subtilisin